MSRAKNTGAGARAEGARLKRFIAHYCVHFNGAAAVRHAGYETVAPSEYARQLLIKREVQDAVEEQIKGLGDLHFRLAEEAISRLRAMMQAQREEIFTPEGVLRDIGDWPDECKLLIAGIEIEELWEGRGDERRPIGNLRKVRLESPKGIIDSLLKVTGRWVERTQFLDKDGRPADPGAIQPNVYITVGTQKPEVIK